MDDVTHYRVIWVVAVALTVLSLLRAFDGVSEPIWLPIVRFMATLMACACLIVYHGEGVDWHGKEEDRD